jgi:cysteinyl-tRNA synthetase
VKSGSDRNRVRHIVVDETKVKALVCARNAARKAQDFKEGDRICDELKAMGVELEDHKDGTTTWKFVQ